MVGEGRSKFRNAEWGGGEPTGAGLVDGIGGGVGAGWQFQRRGRGEVQERVGLLGSSTGGGKGSGGNPRASVPEGFFVGGLTS